MRENRPLPDAIQNAPSLLPGLELYYMAFMELMSTRSFGDMGGLGPIGWDVVQFYGMCHQFDAEQIEALHYHITRMDAHYMKHYARKNGGKSSKKTMKG